MDSNRNTSKVITVVLAGLAVGAAAWYLLKTDKGRQTSELWGNSLQELTNSFKDKVLESFSRLSGQAEEVYDEYSSNKKFSSNKKNS